MSQLGTKRHFDIFSHHHFLEDWKSSHRDSCHHPELSVIIYSGVEINIQYLLLGGPKYCSSPVQTLLC